MIDFTGIHYLKTGTARQQHAYHVLSWHQVLEKLRHSIRSSPHHSDQHRYKKQRLDIICCFSDPLTFKEHIRFSFGREKNFKEFTPSHPGAIATSFELDNFVIGVFGQPVPTREEAAYRHMLIEYKLLEEKGEAFRQQIIVLKNKAIKPNRLSQCCWG